MRVKKYFISIFMMSLLSTHKKACKFSQFQVDILAKKAIKRRLKKFHAFIVLKCTYFPNFMKIRVYLICDRESLKVIKTKI